MTVDGVILENLIRELILSEFRTLIQMQEGHGDEIKKVRSSLMIESQKLLDTTTRLRRLQDECLQKSISDKQNLARKEEVRDLKDSVDLLRTFVNQMQEVTQDAVEDAKMEVAKLQTKFYDRDKPFFKTFGEELISHKSHTGRLIESFKLEVTTDVGKSFKKMEDLRQHVTILDAKLQES